MRRQGLSAGVLLVEVLRGKPGELWWIVWGENAGTESAVRIAARLTRVPGLGLQPPGLVGLRRGRQA